MKKFCKHGHEMTEENTKTRICKGYKITECLTCVRNSTRKKRNQTEKIEKGDEEVVLPKEDATIQKKICDEVSKEIWDSLVSKYGDPKQTGVIHNGMFCDVFVRFDIEDGFNFVGRIRKYKFGEKKYTIWR